MDDERRGCLFLVVGPSGAGKDSLIAGARAVLGGDPGVLFARRYVTRPRGPGAEPHVAVSRSRFATLRGAGMFALHWNAHGIQYGIPVHIEPALAAGRRVVANVSRTVLDDARRRLAPVRVVDVQADARTLRTRLLARGRESHQAVEARLARARAVTVTGDDVVVLRNDASLADGVARLVALLRQPLAGW
jgi:phosphonate metabolism protein PhnN/1,5-bisphosphokinase (PRPP-forming)